MKKNTLSKVITLLSVSLLSAHASATTTYLSEGHLSLDVISFTDKFGVTYDIDNQPAAIVTTAFDNSDDFNFSSNTIGDDAYAEGVTTPISDSGFIDLDTQASGYAGSAYSSAQSDATAAAQFSFENTSTNDYQINMLLSYSSYGNVETDTPFDQQNGEAGTDIDLYGDNNFSQDISTSMMASLLGGSFAGSSSTDFSFSLGVGEVENVFASISSYGNSESVSAVPLPGSIFFMAPAVMGLLFRNKKVSS